MDEWGRLCYNNNQKHVTCFKKKTGNTIMGVDDMGLEEKMDMVIAMVAHMNEEMTETFGQINVKFSQIDERFAQIDERFDRMEATLERFREENAKEHDILRGQIASVAQALNATIVENDVQHCELKANDEALERVQKQHSADIMELRAAI